MEAHMERRTSSMHAYWRWLVREMYHHNLGKVGLHDYRFFSKGVSSLSSAEELSCVPFMNGESDCQRSGVWQSKGTVCLS